MARKQRLSPGPKAPEPAPPTAADRAEGKRPETEALPFGVVGIGASAGGLNAIAQLLRALPGDTGMAFVVVQHLAPTHQSLLAEILARSTNMKVSEVQDNFAVEPNHVYVMPPGKDMILRGGRLQLLPRTATRGQHHPIDHFLRSLAGHQGHRAIGVILSGTASDGTLGLEEIKAAAGVTFAQDSTAEQPGMPHSAIVSGCVDFVLGPEEIANEIGRLARHPFVAASEDAIDALARSEALVVRILDILSHATGVDFSNYKRNTLHRRITRRMLLHKLDNLAEYVRYLVDAPSEADALYQDILINVTGFFRDAEAYETLKTKIFPRLVESKKQQEPIRVWVLGCSTGEEAYSIAMAYVESAGTRGRRIPMQIFATDLNNASIDKARAGYFPKSVAEDVSPERLERFFTEANGGYRISKSIREMCIFARHNVLSDPPFSQMDMIACRNMLIYFEPVLQQRVLPILHYALREPGVLWLGSSETIGGFRNLFEIDDAKNKIFSKKAGSSRIDVPISRRVPVPPPPRPRHTEVAVHAADPQKEADRILLARHTSPAVLVDPRFEIVQFRGDTGRFLSLPAGRANLNLLKMLREGLLVAVRGAVHRAAREKQTVREEDLSLDGYRKLAVTVEPISGPAQENFLLVVFEEAPLASADAEAARSAPAAGKDEEDFPLVRQLRRELDATREYLQSVIEQQESANEELQSANEEIQSTNEELQSVNEELETSKEEIQSSNEELATVNDELEKSNAELSQTNSDLLNLLGSAPMAIVMLDRDLRIRRFTPTAEKMLNLIPADVGRPIGDIKLGLSAVDVETLLGDVIDAVTVLDRMVQDRNGLWFWLRLRPYKSADDEIDGVMIILIEIDQLKRAEQALRESEARFAMLADSAPVLMWVAGPEGQQFVNRAYLEFVGAAQSDVQGYEWTHLIHPDDRDTYLAAYLGAFGQRAPFTHQFRLRRADGEYRWMKAIGTPQLSEGNLTGYVGATFDITELELAQEVLREANRSKNEFLAVLAHELRTPLAAMRNASEVLGHMQISQSTRQRALAVIDQQTRQTVRMVDDLLDLARITNGTIQLRKQTFDLRDAMRQALDATAYQREGRQQQLALSQPDKPVLIEADAARIQQVFANILGNASRYTHEQGHVSVSISHEPVRGGDGGDGAASRTNVVVRIGDDGMGIEPEMLGRIFDLFAQASAGRGNGLGVGLNLARRIVELHNGMIEASSEGLSRGSEFVVRLPVRADGTGVQAARGIDGRTASSAPLRVLVVDDSLDAADMLGSLLRLAGHDVRVTNSGEAALEIAREFAPDLVLLDLSMPGLDGWEVARRLRAEPGLDNPFIVAISGFGPTTFFATQPAHFDDYITKPLEYDAMVSLIQRARGGRRHSEQPANEPER